MNLYFLFLVIGVNFIFGLAEINNYTKLAYTSNGYSSSSLDFVSVTRPCVSVELSEQLVGSLLYFLQKQFLIPNEDLLSQMTLDANANQTLFNNLINNFLNSSNFTSAQQIIQCTFFTLNHALLDFNVANTIKGLVRHFSEDSSQYNKTLINILALKLNNILNQTLTSTKLPHNFISLIQTTLKKDLGLDEQDLFQLTYYKPYYASTLDNFIENAEFIGLLPDKISKLIVTWFKTAFFKVAYRINNIYNTHNLNNQVTLTNSTVYASLLNQLANELYVETCTKACSVPQCSVCQQTKSCPPQNSSVIVPAPICTGLYICPSIMPDLKAVPFCFSQSDAAVMNQQTGFISCQPGLLQYSLDELVILASYLNEDNIALAPTCSDSLVCAQPVTQSGGAWFCRGPIPGYTCSQPYSCPNYPNNVININGKLTCVTYPLVCPDLNLVGQPVVQVSGLLCPTPLEFFPIVTLTCPLGSDQFVCAATLTNLTCTQPYVCTNDNIYQDPVTYQYMCMGALICPDIVAPGQQPATAFGYQCPTNITCVTASTAVFTYNQYCPASQPGCDSILICESSSVITVNSIQYCNSPLYCNQYTPMNTYAPATLCNTSLATLYTSTSPADTCSQYVCNSSIPGVFCPSNVFICDYWAYTSQTSGSPPFCALPLRCIGSNVTAPWDKCPQLLTCATSDTVCAGNFYCPVPMGACPAYSECTSTDAYVVGTPNDNSPLVFCQTNSLNCFETSLPPASFTPLVPDCPVSLVCANTAAVCPILNQVWTCNMQLPGCDTLFYCDATTFTDQYGYTFCGDSNLVCYSNVNVYYDSCPVSLTCQTPGVPPLPIALNVNTPCSASCPACHCPESSCS
jgi:hypothetical protein